jgi:hypothetical protein
LTTPAYSLLVCSRALFIKAVSLSLAQPPLSFSTSVCSLILLILHFQQPRIFIDWPRRFVTTNNCFLFLFFYLLLVFFLHHIHVSSWLFFSSFLWDYCSSISIKGYQIIGFCSLYWKPIDLYPAFFANPPAKKWLPNEWLGKCQKHGRGRMLRQFFNYSYEHKVIKQNNSLLVDRLDRCGCSRILLDFVLKQVDS